MHINATVARPVHTAHPPGSPLPKDPFQVQHSPDAVLCLGQLEAWYPRDRNGILVAGGRQVIGCARGHIAYHNLCDGRDCGSFVGRDTLVQSSVTVLEVPNGQVSILHLYPVQRERKAIFLQRQTDGGDSITLHLQHPNDVYIRRTSQLTSRRCIWNIYSTNILTEYFKHAAHSPFFNAAFLGSCNIHILNTGVLKFKRKFRRQRVKSPSLCTSVVARRSIRDISWWNVNISEGI